LVSSIVTGTDNEESDWLLRRSGKKSRPSLAFASTSNPVDTNAARGDEVGVTKSVLLGGRR